MNPNQPPPQQPLPLVNPAIVNHAVNNVVNGVQAAQPTPVVACPLAAIQQNFLTTNAPLHQQLVSTASTPAKKRKVSEALGEQGVICAESTAQKKQLTEKDFEIFDGRDVFDLVQKDKVTGDVTLFEAKGGKSQFGKRKGKNGMTITQCTPQYARFVAGKMKGTKYNGKHPRVSCGAHTSVAPLPTCKNCRAAERKRRNDMGSAILTADTQGKLHKKAVRADYNQSGLKTPQVITSW